jgi:simple sugar transport system ATP-binding protein
MVQLKIQASSTQVPVEHLSGGNQQKVMLAKWLATSARILILNRPTVGVDIAAKIEMHRKIKELTRRGMGFLVISDDLPEILSVCNRVFLMHRGRLMDEWETAAIQQDDLTARIDELT